MCTNFIIHLRVFKCRCFRGIQRAEAESAAAAAESVAAEAIDHDEEGEDG